MQIQHRGAVEVIYERWQLLQQVPAQIQFTNVRHLLDTSGHRGEAFVAEVQPPSAIRCQVHAFLNRSQSKRPVLLTPFLLLGHIAAEHAVSSQKQRTV